jgi:hypothetical protein
VIPVAAGIAATAPTDTGRVQSRNSWKEPITQLANPTLLDLVGDIGHPKWVTTKKKVHSNRLLYDWAILLCLLAAAGGAKQGKAARLLRLSEETRGRPSPGARRAIGDC